MSICWMVNNSGGSKRVDISLRDQRINEGWQLLSSNDLDAKGNPKQMYNPRLDKNNKAYIDPIKSETGNISDLLTVEIF